MNSEKFLRQYIRQLILEKGEWRQKYQAGHSYHPFPEAYQENIDAKKYFHKNANQKSLQKLVYVHWAMKRQVFKLLNTAWKNNGKSRSEINTTIYPPNQKMSLFDIDNGQSHTKIGLMVKGWVSFASNIDLDSGRMGSITKNSEGLRNKADKDMLQQQIEFGLNKRPSITMIKDRIHNSNLDGENPVLVGDEELWSPEDWKLALILKAEDLQLQPDLSDELEAFTLNWPEAFIDNWKPIAIVVHTTAQPNDWYELLDTELPLVDEDRDVWVDIYTEYVEYQAENIQYEIDNNEDYELEESEKRFLEAEESGDLTIAFPYLKGWI